MDTDLQKLFQTNEPCSIKSLEIPSSLKVMVLAPHPDDTDAVGVTLKFLQENGNPVEVGVARTGSGVESNYHPGATIDDMADIREAEQQNSLFFFGLPKRCLTFLSVTNDTEDQIIDTPENLAVLGKFVTEKKPDIIFLPHGNDTNSAHRAMYSLFTQIAKRANRQIAGFLNRDPKTIKMQTDLYMPFDENMASWKAEMLRFHDSQHQRNLHARGYGFDERILDYNKQIAYDLSIDAKYAEAFEIDFF